VVDHVTRELEFVAADLRSASRAVGAVVVESQAGR
jgi:hypothetical protein